MRALDAHAAAGDFLGAGVPRCGRAAPLAAGGDADGAECGSHCVLHHPHPLQGAPGAFVAGAPGVRGGTRRRAEAVAGNPPAVLHHPCAAASRGEGPARFSEGAG